MAPTPRFVLFKKNTAGTALAFFIILLSGVVSLHAENTPRFADYQEYSPPVETGIAFPAAQLAWLNQVFDLMGSKDFTFVYRVDPNHWIGLYRERLSMILHIHNGTAPFDFRAEIDRHTGTMDVVRGVSYKGMQKAESAKTAARMAIGYLQRVLANKDIFGSSTGVMAQADAMPSSTSKAPDMHSTPAPKPMDTAKTSDTPMAPSASKGTGTMPDDPLSRLLAGNSRFVSGNLQHPNQSPEYRETVAKGQHPFAIVLTCSDSRLPPELIFDQGLGDIFVVRTAGEAVGDYELGSIEYAAEHLHVGYILVLGHERCGAVDATVKGGQFSENITRIAQQIKPAVDAAKGKPGDLLDNAIRQQAINAMARVEESPVLAELVKEKKLTFNAAYFDLDTGVVSVLE